MESGFTRCISEGFDFSVIEVTAAVEDHCADVGTLGTFCDELADLLGALDIRGGLFEGFVERRSGDESLAGSVVDDLCVDVLVGIVNGEARALCGSGNFAADAVVDATADAFAIDHAHIAEMN